MDSNVNILNSKENEIVFKLEIEGLDASNKKVCFIIETSDMDFSFKCIDLGNNDWIVKIPALPQLEAMVYPCHIEVILDGYYFVPMNGTVNVIKDPELSIHDLENITFKPPTIDEPEVNIKIDVEPEVEVKFEPEIKSNIPEPKPEFKIPSVISPYARRISEIEKNNNKELTKIVKNILDETLEEDEKLILDNKKSELNNQIKIDVLPIKEVLSNLGKKREPISEKEIRLNEILEETKSEALILNDIKPNVPKSIEFNTLSSKEILSNLGRKQELIDEKEIRLNEILEETKSEALILDYKKLNVSEPIEFSTLPPKEILSNLGKKQEPISEKDKKMREILENKS